MAFFDMLIEWIIGIVIIVVILRGVYDMFFRPKEEDKHETIKKTKR